MWVGVAQSLRSDGYSEPSLRMRRSPLPRRHLRLAFPGGKERLRLVQELGYTQGRGGTFWTEESLRLERGRPAAFFSRIRARRGCRTGSFAALFATALAISVELDSLPTLHA